MKTKLGLTVLVVVSWIGGACGADWYHPAWRRRQMVTVNANAVGVTLTNFPLLVVLTDPASHVWAEAQPDGKDILFTAGDGTTRIPAEVEKLDRAGQRLWAWVRLPVLSATTSTNLYMYYGNIAAGDQSDTNVWDAGYAAVYHLAESPDDGVAGHVDSSGNGNHGTPMKFQDDPIGDTAAAGIIDGADRFGGSNEYVTVRDSDTLNLTTNMTLSFWMKPQKLGRTQRVLMHWSPGSTHGYGLLVDFYNSNKLLAILNNGPVRLYQYSKVFNPDDTNRWHHIALRYNGTRLQWYINGVADTYANGTLTNGLSTHSLDFGYKNDSASDPRFLDGFLDEIRISRTARSVAWLQTCHSNQVAPGVFSSFAATEAAAGTDPNRPAWPASLMAWSFRQRVTVNSAQVPGVLADFPVVMTETNVTAGLWAHAQADGGDIRFTAADGLTRISHEIEAFDAGAKRLTIWLGIPSLTPAANTPLYMYYGSRTAGGADPDGVWTNHFSLVQHLNEASGTLLDSSPAGNHGTAMQDTVQGVAGWLGKAAAFDGTNDYVALTTAIAAGSKTYSCWLWPDGAQPTPGHCVFGDYQMIVSVDIYGRHRLGHYNGTDYVLTDTFLVPSAWHHLAVSMDAATGHLAMYVDGVLRGTNSTARYTALALNRSLLGLAVYPANVALRGILDEARIETVVRPADWIQACYANQSDPGLFLYGGWEEQAPAGTTLLLR